MISSDPFRSNPLGLTGKKLKTKSIDAQLGSLTARENSLPAIRKTDRTPSDFATKAMSYRDLKKLGGKFVSLDAGKLATDRLPVVASAPRTDSKIEENSQSRLHRDKLQSHSSFAFKKTSSFSSNGLQRPLLEEQSLPTDPKTKTSLTFDLKSERSKATRLKLSYSKINFYSVKDNDLFVLTQATKPKPEQPEASSPPAKQGRQNGALKARLQLAKSAVAEDRQFADLQLADTFHLRLLIMQEGKQGLSCFEKSVPTMKLVENYTIFHYLHFDNAYQVGSPDKTHRFLKKLKTFLQKGSTGAFEISSLASSLRDRFDLLEQSKRPFLQSTQSFTIHYFEQLLLIFLFLEYQSSMTVEKINQIIDRLKKQEAENESLLKKQLSIKELPDIEPSPELPSEQLDMADREKKILADAKRLSDLMPHTLHKATLSRQKHPEDEDFVYHSVNLRRIELCLEHQDILFDMDAPVFNSLLDLKDFDIDQELVARYPMAEEKKKIYFDLIALRSIMREQNKTVGNYLVDALDLLRVSDDSYYSDHSSEGLRQDSSDTGQSLEAVETVDRPS